MPTTVSYPGLYIEELPLNAHTIAAAPTSITVIVGYTHPFKTKAFQEAVRLANFTEYEREFGGMFTSGLIENHVPHAVNQFFLNGGSDLYVVGLIPRVEKAGTTDDYAKVAGSTVDVKDPDIILNTSITFTALEPSDVLETRMKVKLSNLTQSDPSVATNPYDIFDLTIFYGSRVETFRRVTVKASVPGARALYTVNGISRLVTVSDIGGKTDGSAAYGKGFSNSGTIDKTLSQPAGYSSGSSPQDFIDMFKADTSLDKVPIFNIILTPGIFQPAVNAATIAFAERKRAFAIIDAAGDRAADESLKNNVPPVLPVMGDQSLFPGSENGAIYFPYLLTTDPLSGAQIEVAPSGYVAGIYARTDSRRGVWKAPAGIETTLNNTIGVVPRGRMTNEQQGILYGSVTSDSQPINCLRSFPGSGTVVFGARTLVGNNTAYPQSKYVPVRRMTLFIEQTLLANLRWVVFEPNDEPLWLSIRSSIEGFMMSLFNQGALQGSKASDAFQVKCDHSTTTQDDINNGIVNIIVAFAPLKPAEFVIIKIAQLTGQSQS